MSSEGFFLLPCDGIIDPNRYVNEATRVRCQRYVTSCFGLVTMLLKALMIKAASTETTKGADRDREARAQDAAWLSGLVKGDQRAAEQIYEAYATMLLSVGLSMLADRSKAEDLVQESFLRLWKNAGDLEEKKAPLKPWLLRVMSNLCIDALRKHTEILSDVIPEMSSETVEGSDRYSRNPHAALEQEQLAHTIDLAFDQLPDRQRLALTLTARLQMSAKEASEIMNVSVRALESLIARGRRSLRVSLAAIAYDYGVHSAKSVEGHTDSKAAGVSR